MKLLIFAGYFYPHKGGYEDHIYQFCRLMSKKGYSITVLTTNTNKSPSHESINPNFEIYRIPVIDALNGTYPIPIPNLKFMKIMNRLKKENFDVVMTRTRFFTTSFLGLLFSKIINKPLVHVEHGSCHTITDNYFVSLVNQIFDHTIGFLIVKNSAKNIGVSKKAVDFIKHLGSKNSLIINRGVDSYNYNKNHKSLKQIKNIIFVGRLIYAKGVQDLILAFSQIKDIDLNLTIVGDGPYKKDLENQVAKLNLQSKIKFVGEKNKTEVISLLKGSDLFINPSYSEGLPTSVLEAGTVGLPVIATDVGGTSEVIITNKTGILIPPKDTDKLKDAIKQMTKDPKKASDMAKSLNNIIKDKFNWKNVIIKWELILKEEI